MAGTSKSAGMSRGLACGVVTVAGLALASGVPALGVAPPPPDAPRATRPASVVPPAGTTPSKASPANPKGGNPAAVVVPPVGKPAAGGEQGVPGKVLGEREAGNEPPEGGIPAVEGVPSITTDDGMVEFSNFTDGVELTALVEIAAETLQLNIMQMTELSGSIVFNAPIKIPKDKLLDLVKAWLELYGYSMVFDARTQFYVVMKASSLPPDFNGFTTKVIPTPGIRPSSIKTSVDALVPGTTSTVVGGSAAGAAKGRAVQGQVQPMNEDGTPIAPGGGGASSGTSGGSGGRITYNDELGLIIVIDTERRLAQIEQLVAKIMSEYAEITAHEIELKFIAPSTAKQRILELFGQAPPATQRQNNRGYEDPNQQQQVQPTAKVYMDNLAERLSASPNGNSLFFRGRQGELDSVREVVALIDKQPNLVPETYIVGASAKAIADIARQRGMGDVTTIASADEARLRMNYGYFDGGQSNQNRPQTALSGGPVMVVDEGRGQIIYYATEKLHEQMKELIKTIKPENDSVIMRDYRLTHADAEKVAEVVLGLLRNQEPSGGGDNPLLPGSNGGRNGGNTFVLPPDVYGMNRSGDLSISGRDSFVIADKANNQVIVKAPAKEQPYFKELISRLDRPVPQVYVEAKIVAVTGSDTFRLAFETQLINARGTGGVFDTNFGLTSVPTGGDILSRRVVTPGLAGGTAALIKNDQVPIVMQVLQTVSDAKVLSMPQLLVSANVEESKVESKDQQPTAQRNLSNGTGGGGSTDVISFGQYVDAGTKLTIKKPQIGPGNSIRMGLDIELSSFTGEATDTLPPPIQKNNIITEVQVPANMTVVVGGVVVDSKRKTVKKIPLLGDIPLFGALFSDQGSTDIKTTLYVFITPKILRDQTFQDHKLISSGPLKATELSDGMPGYKPVIVEFSEIKEEPAK